MTQPVALASVATAGPPYRIEQRDIALAANDGFTGRFKDDQRLARVFETSGIRSRYLVRPLDWYFQPLGWPERNAAYVYGAVELFVDAASLRVEAAGIGAQDVDALVTISSTGIAHSQPGGPGRRPSGLSPTSSACRFLVWAAPAACPAWRLAPASPNASQGAWCWWCQSNSHPGLPAG